MIKYNNNSGSLWPMRSIREFLNWIENFEP